MPQINHEAEYGLLASVLTDAFADFETIRAKVHVDDFDSESARLLYAATNAVFDRDGAIPDRKAIAAELQAEGKLDKIEPVVIDNAFTSRTSGTVDTFIECILDASLLRAAYHAAQRFARAAKIHEGLNSDELVSQLNADINAVLSRRETTESRLLVDVEDQVLADAERIALNGGVYGVPWPTPVLTQQIGNVEFGQLVVIGAATSHGKSALSYQWAAFLAEHDIPVAINSLEMKDTALARRYMSSETGIPVRDIAKGKLNEDAHYLLSERRKKVSRMPFYIASRSPRSLSDIIRWCSSMVRKHEVKFLVVDYMQLITMGRDGNRGTKNEELETIANELQSFAIANNVVLVCPSQVSRGGKDRDDKTPTNDDLRNSGGIGQSADVVVMLSRLSAYMAEGARPGADSIHDVTVNVTKNRNDATPRFTIGWIPNKVKFVDLVNIGPDGQTGF